MTQINNEYFMNTIIRPQEDIKEWKELIFNLIKRIRLKHNWPLIQYVENYIARCETCQKNKLKERTKALLEIMNTARRSFEKCALDIVGPLTMNNHGNKYILPYKIISLNSVKLYPYQSYTHIKKLSKYQVYNFASAVFFRNSRLYCKKLVIHL